MGIPRVLARTNSAKSSDKKLDVDVAFTPKSLTAKCRHLVECYHAVCGYANLPDILWQPGPRDLIETYYPFDHTLKRACTVRSTRRADEGFVEIATTILSHILGNAQWKSPPSRFSPLAARSEKAMYSGNMERRFKVP
jgi:hypothetical protein